MQQSKIHAWTFFLLGTLLALLHLVWLRDFPGFHYDEAWSAQHSLRITTEAGFWPITAMSPYTNSWTHYIAAAFFRVFGVSLTVFRFSQTLLSLTGLLLLLAFCRRHYNDKTALSFLVLLLSLPALILNHRFAIELTTFHVFCFALFYVFYREGRTELALLAAWFGVTSHLLFFAPVLALLGEQILERREISRRERYAWLLLFAALLPHFVRIAVAVPEAAKAWALVGVLFFLFFFLLLRLERFFSEKICRGLGWLLLLLALPFLGNLFFFAAGDWSLAISSGQALALWQIAVSAIVVLFLCFFLWQTKKRSGLLLCVVFSGLMMLKPAPRYYELSLLWLCLSLAPTLASLDWGSWRRAIFFFGALHAAVLFAFYFTRPVIESDLHFLLWKDSSRDFLQKQKLVREGLSGCQLSDIKSVDSRVYAALEFLQVGDWPHTGSCKGELRIEHGEAVRSAKDALHVADFAIWGLR